MKLLSFLALSTLVTPAFAQEMRQMGSHEHGVGQLDIAFDGTQIAMELHAPGADIVGFEYPAQSAEDVAKVDAALLVLARPLDLFALPDAAQCTVVTANVELESEDHGDDHEDHEDEHDHDDHDEDHEDDHGHDDHDDHAQDAGHTEFHAEYLLNCENVAAASAMSFAYFAAFPNAREIDVQVISDAGAMAFEVARDTPTLDLSDLQ